jgi:hypothetical protein
MVALKLCFSKKKRKEKSKLAIKGHERHKYTRIDYWAVAVVMKPCIMPCHIPSGMSR